MNAGFRAGAALAALLALGCQERLATPADCPALCPGTSPEVLDTVLFAVPSSDSTFDGYLSLREVPSLLVSAGLPGREARAFVRFPQRSDSINVGGTWYQYTVDSLVLTFTLQGRDSTARDTKLLLHRIGHGIDTTTTFTAVNDQLTPTTLIDSVLVADTARGGSNWRVLLTGDELNLITPPEDTGVVALGLAMSADKPTGIRISVAPTFVTYARIDIADTTLQRQSLTLLPDFANYAVDGGEPPAAADLLYLGTRRGARSLIRFEVPPGLRDSVKVLRATLELTAAAPIPGLPGDPGIIQAFGIVTDFGAKSPLFPTLLGSQTVEPGITAVSIDVRSVVALWFVPDPPPAALFLRVVPEAGSFTLPEFFSTRSPAGAPRIRLTYAKPTQPGHP